MKTFSKPSDSIKWSKERLINFGQEVEIEKWQSTKAPDTTWELMNHSFQFTIPETREELVKEVKPNLPWANDHFNERVSGLPLNPPPSHNWWPYAQKNNEQFGGLEKFSHTYPERIWPKYRDITEDGISPIKGFRYGYGDFGDVIDLLRREPFTRQAFLPIWFPEDTGSVHGERVPCSIGYHFMRRNDRLHMVYYIRSCDYIRHFRDDIYMACLKLFWILEKLGFDEKWQGVKPGYFAMHITSLHCFNKEKGVLNQSKY
jgi:hypothetical protein